MASVSYPFGTSGVWKKIGTLYLPPGAPTVQVLPFSNLNGNAMRAFKMLGHIRQTGAFAVNYEITANNNSGTWAKWGHMSNGAATTNSAAFCMRASSTNSWLNFEATIGAAAEPTTTPERVYQTTWGTYTAAGALELGGVGGGVWSDVTNNITQLELRASNVTITAGSVVSLYYLT